MFASPYATCWDLSRWDQCTVKQLNIFVTKYLTFTAIEIITEKNNPAVVFTNCLYFLHFSVINKFRTPERFVYLQKFYTRNFYAIFVQPASSSRNCIMFVANWSLRINAFSWSVDCYIVVHYYNWRPSKRRASATI